MGVITKIEFQKKRAERASVWIDGEFAFGAPAIVIAEQRLKVGDEIDDERMAHLAAEADRDGAWNDGLAYVAARLHTVREIRIRLREKGYADDAIDRAVEKLLAYGYADDAAYARAYVADHAHADGPRKLRYDLRAKGIDDAAIDAALADLDENAACAALAAKRLRNHSPADKKTYARTLNYLLARGFSRDAVRAALGALDAPDDEEDPA